MLQQWKAEGLSISAMARRSGLDRKTVRKYLERRLETPSYGPRAPRAQRLDPYRSYLRQRIEAYPQLRGRRLLRELRELGYAGSYSPLTDYLREIRPPRESGFEHRFETAPAQQGQVDFARFKTVFRDEPDRVQIVWLFSLVLGFSRYLIGEFVRSQSLAVLLRCHLRAFAELGGVPRELLYDRMKTAVLGEDDAQQLIYHPRLLELAGYFGFTPRACAPYRAKTKGKVERPFHYVREDFFLAGDFQNDEDLNQQFFRWRSEVANVRRHGTTRRIVTEAFAEERPQLLALPERPFDAVLSLKRRISRDGMVSVDGNAYSVPDTARRRSVEVHSGVEEIRIYDRDRLIAVHPVLEGRGERRVAPGHRRWPLPGSRQRCPDENLLTLSRPGDQVTRRALSVYATLGEALARESGS